MMAGIKGVDTKPERALRCALHRLGLRYRLHAKDLPGRPDIVLPKYRAAIQVHGCFWHRHESCIYASTPASNRSFWRKKFKETVKRDKRKMQALTEAGWRLAIIWECAIKRDSVGEIAKEIRVWLRSDETFLEIS